MTEDDRWPEDWHNSQPVAVAGGIAAAVLVCLLIYAVMSVSDASVAPRDVIYPPTSPSGTSTAKTTSTTTSYGRPSVQTSEGGPPPALAPTTAQEPPPDAPTAEEEPTTTNPYATTTTDRAGSI